PGVWLNAVHVELLASQSVFYAGCEFCRNENLRSFEPLIVDDVVLRPSPHFVKRLETCATAFKSNSGKLLLCIEFALVREHKVIESRPFYINILECGQIRNSSTA